MKDTTKAKGKENKVSKTLVKTSKKDIVSVKDGMIVIQHPHGNTERYNEKYYCVEGLETTPPQQKIDKNKKGTIPDGLSRNEYKEAGGNLKDFKAYIERQEKLMNDGETTGTVSTKTPVKRTKQGDEIVGYIDVCNFIESCSNTDVLLEITSKSMERLCYFLGKPFPSKDKPSK